MRKAFWSFAAGQSQRAGTKRRAQGAQGCKCAAQIELLISLEIIVASPLESSEEESILNLPL